MRQQHRLLFFGDLHGSFEHCLPVVEECRPEAIILLGDIQANVPAADALREVMKITQVWWIPGNHDTDSQAIYDNIFEGDLADRNLHGRVVEIAGHRIAGLGGVFRGKIWYPQHGRWAYFSKKEFTAKITETGECRAKLLLRHRSSIFPEDYMRLKRQKADILVTHEAPSCNRYGFFVLDRLARRMGVKRMFHGHHHDRFDYSPYFSKLGFNAYSVGLRSVCGLNGELVLAGQEDGSSVGRMLRNPLNV